MPLPLENYSDDESDSDYGAPPQLPLLAAVRQRRKRNLDKVELGDGSVLPRAREAASSVPTNPVEQSRILPAAAEASRPRADFGSLVSGYDTKLNSYDKELQELNKDPDYSALSTQARERGGQGVQAMMAALAAGMGPKDMRGLQPGLQQEAAHLMGPQKIEGGEVDVSGQVRLDPGYKRQKQIESLRATMDHLERQKLSAVTAEERYRIEEQQNRLMNEFRQSQLEMQRQAAADRVAAQREIAQMRADAQRDAAEARRQAAADKAAAKGGGGLNDKDRYAVEDRMGDDFRAQTKNYVTELDSAKKILSLPTDRRWSPIEQQSAIVMLNKILDPNSVVREGEFDRVAQAQGVFQRAQLALEKLTTGATLSPQLAADIRGVADFYNTASQKRLDAIAQDYTERASRRGIDHRNVVGVRTSASTPSAPAPQPPPKIGDIVDGHRFKGGDPKQASSWER
jgi:hypothetical protein